MPADELWPNHIPGSTPQGPDASVPAEDGPPPSEELADAAGDAPGRTVPTLIPMEPPAPSPSYRLAAFAVVAWAVALALAAYDEYWSLPHAAAINAALFLLGVLAIFSLSVTLKQARAWRRTHTVVSAAIRDRVTGLPNYRYLHMRLDEEASRAKRYRRPLTLAVIDANSLHSVNERYGWTCGDEVLRHLANVLNGRRRGSDIVTRLADGHFAIILPDCDEQGARALIERLEQHLAREPARVEVDGKPMHLWVGICAGVAVQGEEPEGAIELVRRAEADLRAAKADRDKRRRLWLSA